MPNSIKNSASLMEFKTKIKTWAADHCLCRICKKYVGRKGFIHVVPQVLVLSSFCWTFCTSYFLVVIPLMAFFLKISDLAIYLNIWIFNFIYSRAEIFRDCRDFRQFYRIVLFFFHFIFHFYRLFFLALISHIL